MPLGITNNSKNDLTITNLDKGYDLTWADHTESWADAPGSWETQRVLLTKGTKNSLTITNESKN